MTKHAVEFLMDWAMTHSKEEQIRFANFYDSEKITRIIKGEITVGEITQMIEEFNKLK